MHISSPRAPAPCILSLDIGSTSVRARLYDAEARPVPNAGHEIRRRPQPDGEEDAEQIRELCEETITKALEAAGATDPAAGHIDAVAVAMFVGNVLGIDAKGNAATPLYTYAHASARSEVEELRSRLDPELTYDRTGTPFHTSYQAPRILWVKNNEPDLYSKTARWIDLGTYLYSKWFDSLDVPSSYSAASWSGMLDRAKPAWYGPILEAIGISLDALPRLADYSSAMQGLAPHWAARWPALANVPFYLAVGDGAGAFRRADAAATHEDEFVGRLVDQHEIEITVVVGVVRQRTRGRRGCGESFLKREVGRAVVGPQQPVATEAGRNPVEVAVAVEVRQVRRNRKRIDRNGLRRRKIAVAVTE